MDLDHSQIKKLIERSKVDLFDKERLEMLKVSLQSKLQFRREKIADTKIDVAANRKFFETVQKKYRSVHEQMQADKFAEEIQEKIEESSEVEIVLKNYQVTEHSRIDNLLEYVG